MSQGFQELAQLEAIIAQLGDRARVEVVERIAYKGRDFPIYSIALGSMRPDVPVLAYFGGVHGLEKIGSEVILSYLQTIAQLLDWDEEFASRLEKSRLVFVPIVNPVGVYRGTRCNGNGVDLMRNAPVEGIGHTKLYSGHRLSPRLPWFRGDASQMEKEAQALCRVVEQTLFNAPLSIAVDLHSGFGLHDRLWFPYASCKKPLPSLAEAYAWKALFDRCYPNHFYKIEPMSQEYVISGDLWDYLYDQFEQRHQGQKLFLPLTLEMGSWLWLRKSPLHLFQRHGLFHPLLPHRQQRILRRHFTLFDFLYRSLLYPEPWAHLQQPQKKTLTAKKRWRCGMQNKLGRHWLLLRGLSREAAHWGEFLTMMQATFPSARIDTLDLPGTGRFYRQTSPSSICDITVAIRRLAFEQGLLQEPVTVLALSLGGMVAWEWMQTYPDDINGAVLVNSSFASLSPFYQRLRWQSYGKFAQVLAQTDIYRRELAIIRLVSRRRSLDQSLARQWEKIQMERPVSWQNSLKQIIAAANYKPSIGRPRQPVVLLNSRGDGLVAPSCSEAIHRQWQIELHTHPWAGHDLSLDDGAWLAQQLKNWAGT